MNKKLQTTRIELAEHQRNIWAVVPEAGASLDDVVKPEYWAHVAARMKPWDRIDVMPEDGSYFAELLVRDAARLYAKVTVLRHVKLDAVASDAADETTALFDVAYVGPVKKWRVMRKADKAPLREGFQSRGDAEEWLRQHIRTVAQPPAAA